jgi:hypothetical protein
MAEPAICDWLHTSSLEHPAVRAWAKLHGPPRTPPRIEVLKPENKKSAVYRVDHVGPSGSSVIAKRCKLQRLALERGIYEQVLPDLPLPTLQFYGSWAEPDAAYGWLFLEDAGDERFCSGSAEHRALAGRWLGTLHTSLAGERAKGLGLPRRGLDFHREMAELARDRVRESVTNPAMSADDLSVLERILSHCDCVASHWPEIEAVCNTVPEVLVHGDFGAKNVRVRRRGGALEILPLDWDGAGWGLPADDLAQVEAGVYWSIVRHHWPGLTADAVDRLANIGKIFWNLIPITDEAETLNSDWVGNVMRKLRAYEAGIAEATAAEGWGHS